MAPAMTATKSSLTAPILLEGGGVTTHVAPANVYFAFGDGRLTYDCAPCQGKCCRGFGYSLRPAELELQLRSRPLLRVFVMVDQAQPNTTHEVHNCPPSCFFLKADSRGSVPIVV